MRDCAECGLALGGDALRCDHCGHPTGQEVLVDGRKLVGLSQVRRAAGVLLQVGVLGGREGDLADLLDLTPPERSRAVSYTHLTLPTKRLV